MFTYRSPHADHLKRRSRWFAATPQPSTALWWITAGTRPTLDDALRRPQLLRRYGPTPRAFSLRRRSGPDGRGDYLYVPPGGIHAFRNDSGQPAAMLLLFAPGAPRERYFEELAERARSGRPWTDDELADLLNRHDQYPSPHADPSDAPR